MNIQTFWKLIETAKVQSDNDLPLQVKILVDTLAQRSEDEIIAFGRLFDCYDGIAYTRFEDVCAEVFGIGDSSFKDFIGWLIAQGRKVYWDAFHDPDTLADVEQQDDSIYLEEMLYAAHYAYRRKTNQEFLPVTTAVFRSATPRPRRKREQLTEEMIAQKYPKLTAKIAAYHSIEDRFTALIGQKAWGVKLGEGSFLSIEFGKSIAPYITKRGRDVIHGEWHLWIYDAGWSLIKDRHVIIHSEDDREKIEHEIKALEGATLEEMYTIVPEFYTSLKFDNGLILSTDFVDTKNAICWMLFTPEKKVLQAGPGKNWTYEDE
jgi:hypothetical protein